MSEKGQTKDPEWDGKTKHLNMLRNEQEEQFKRRGGTFQLRWTEWNQKAKWDLLPRVISQQQSSNHHIPRTMPGQLEKSQTSSHFSKQNGQEDTKGNMKGRGGRGRKKRGSEGKMWKSRNRGGEKKEVRHGWKEGIKVREGEQRKKKGELRRRWRRDKEMMRATTGEESEREREKES